MSDFLRMVPHFVTPFLISAAFSPKFEEISGFFGCGDVKTAFLFPESHHGADLESWNATIQDFSKELAESSPAAACRNPSSFWSLAVPGMEKERQGP